MHRWIVNGPAETGPVTASTSRGTLRTPVLFGLAAVTGIVDAACYLGFGHVFTANMTGNVVLLGFAIVGVESVSVTRSVTALGAFLVGAVLGVRLARSIDPSAYRWPAAAFGSEAALLFVSATVAGCRSDGPEAPATAVYFVIVLTGLAMGLRNATIRRLGEREVNTTVLTMTLTGIGADSVFAGGSNQGVLRRVGFVMSVMAGAAAGALLLRYSATLTLGVAGAASTVCAVAAYVDRQPLSRIAEGTRP
jgi:uncharacterized membrane protein YoaK (UPF0700 family)